MTIFVKVPFLELGIPNVSRSRSMNKTWADIHIFRMSNVINGYTFKLFLAVTEYFTHLRINFDQLSLKTHQTHSDIGIFKSQTETFLDLLQSILCPLSYLCGRKRFD